MVRIKIPNTMNLTRIVQLGALISLRPLLREGKGMKRIILKYSSIPLFGSFNKGNGKSISLFERLSGRERMSVLPKLGGMEWNR